MIHKNKVVIVTGAGQGIGFEICKMLAKSGAHIILNDIDNTLAQKASQEINDNNGSCMAVAGDASNQDVIEAMVKTAVEVFGKLDVVIANAGITLYGDFISYSRESFSRVMKVNLEGSFFLAQAAAKQMKEQPPGGTLLFMSSVTGHQAHKNLAAYGMTKAALEMLAKNLVIELSQFKINVNAIAPGATLTSRTIAEDNNYEATWSKITPMGRPASVSDIAKAVLFLISDDAKHITGQTLIVDGGWTSISPSPY
ncbi:MAG: 2-dehydro-3-deoxy-D-gluconate 5-dehydrogenase [Chitinophagaceae bacterium]|nr:2-dehydro-3-deoxy-D-gluconate 5-dehydrogenase [Chitinophagaceae bacterium]